MFQETLFPAFMLLIILFAENLFCTYKTYFTLLRFIHVMNCAEIFFYVIAKSKPKSNVPDKHIHLLLVRVEHKFGDA